LLKGRKCQFSGGKLLQTKKPFSENEKGWLQKKSAPKSKKLELNSTNLRLKRKKHA
jgi:hypothetical protein